MIMLVTENSLLSDFPLTFMHQHQNARKCKRQMVFSYYPALLALQTRVLDLLFVRMPSEFCQKNLSKTF